MVLPLSFDFYLKQKTWLKTDVGYRYKVYDENNLGEQVSYHALFFSAALSKKWEQADVLWKLRFIPGVEHRIYTDLEAEDREDEESALVVDERNWTYYTADLIYDFTRKISLSAMPWVCIPPYGKMLRRVLDIRK